MKIYKKQTEDYDCISSLSGGLDTTVLVYWLKQQGKNPLCVFFDYKQKAVKKEKMLAKRTCRKLKLDLLVVPFRFYPNLVNSYIFKNVENFEKGVQFWLEGRNVLIALVMAIVASRYNVKEVYLGSHRPDGGWETETYPDATIQCYNAINEVIRNSFKKNDIKVVCPFNDKDFGKKEIVELGNRIRVRFKDTFTCCEEGKEHCWKCEACETRMKAFKLAGIQDPLFTYSIKC